MTRRLTPLVLTLFSACGAPSGASPSAHVATTSARVEHLIPPQSGFYSKRMWYSHVPILAHASVSDEALQAAHERLSRMLSGAPRLRSNLEREKFELHIIGLRQFASDLPEHRAQRGTKTATGELFDWHMIGGHIVGRYGSCSEATLLPVVGHRLFGDDTCLHELAHAIYGLGIGREMQRRIGEQYEHSRARWKDTYAASNEFEFFAETTKLYFKNASDLSLYLARPTSDRAWLHATDPETESLLASLYADAADPGTPRFEPLKLQSPANERSLGSSDGRFRSHVLVKNDTGGTVHAIWIDYEKARHPLPTDYVAAAGGYLDLQTYSTHAWVILDQHDAVLCTFVAPDADAEASLTGKCD
jgi:hypothetical protein